MSSAYHRRFGAPGLTTMFVAQAHSFTQQARLAITLAWIAGYTNIITILAAGTVTSHVSGTTSNLGRDIAEGKWLLGAYAFYLLATFLLGAMISGFATEFGKRRAWESVYVLPMAIEAVLLAAFAVAIELHPGASVAPGETLFWYSGIASAAMGLQNATVTRISSGVVRTTHVTGVLTDLGLETIQLLWWLRDRKRNTPPGSSRSILQGARRHPAGRRLAMLLSIIGSFAFGAGLGTIIHVLEPALAMFPPVLFLVWIIYQDVQAPIVEIEPSRLIGGDDSLRLPEALAIYHLRHEAERKSRYHRMPDLLAWAGRLPARVRIVILDLADVTNLDPNSALELRALINQFMMQGRHLVISGLNEEQIHQLRQAGEGVRLENAHICPDLELAIARGINLAEDLLNATTVRRETIVT